jgi:D-alanine-D-alanine ligase
VDFFLTPNNEIIINELNTMPGFTATSVFPKMWQASGVGYTEVISALLESALTRNNGVLAN